MTGNFKNLIEHFRKHPHSVLTFNSISEELDINYDKLRDALGEVTDEKSIFDLGNDRYMFSDDRVIVAFEIFRGIAPNVTQEEFLKFQDEPHILMRMSREREVGAHFTSAEEEPVGRKDRGNKLSF